MSDDQDAAAAGGDAGSSFPVELAIYRGPLDLLLYLVRKHELDLHDIPIADITDQFMAHLEVLESLNVDAVGDFLAVASSLLEIKSRMLLPQEPTEAEEPVEDPREHLVEQLLAYKRYKDVASVLEERARTAALCFVRTSNDLPPRHVDPADQPIGEVELWDLVSALGRVLRDHEVAQPENIVYDDTPIDVYMQQIHGQLAEKRQVAFSDMFCPGMPKGALIGVFLAILELVRHHCVLAEQEGLHGEIVLRPGDNFSEMLDIAPLQSPR